MKHRDMLLLGADGLYVAPRGVHNLVTMMVAVVVYTTPTCPYCLRAKALLDKKGVSYREIDVSGDSAMRAHLLEVTGRRTVPQIFIGERPIGGCDDLYELDRKGLLDPMLSGAIEETCGS